jgi:hypothetical protein
MLLSRLLLTVFINTLFLIATSLCLNADIINFTGPLDYIELNNGSGVYSDTPLGTTFSGFIDDGTIDGTINGEITDGTTKTTFNCCIAAGGLSVSNNHQIDTKEAALLNSLPGSPGYFPGDIVDIINIEVDATTLDNGRIEIGLSYIFDSSTFTNENSNNYPFNHNDVRLALFFLYEEDEQGEDVYSGAGSLKYPAILSITPQDASAGVPITSSIIVQFDRQMDTSTIEIELEDSFNIEITGNHSFSSTIYPNDTAIFTPSQALDYSMGYEVNLENALDIYGNKLFGQGKIYETFFFTEGAPGDTSSPKIVSTYPFDGQSGWDWNLIYIIVNKPLDPSTVNPSTIVFSGPNNPSYSIEYECDLIQLLKIRPNGTLLPNTDYTITMTTGLTDNEGHPLSENYVFTFNTGPTDTTPPTIVQTQPENGATNHQAFGEVTIFFSESINVTTINSRTIIVQNLTTGLKQPILMDDLGDADGIRTFVNLCPANQNNYWTIGDTYRVTIDSSISDWTGSTLGSDYIFEFTVANFDNAAPSMFIDDFIGIRRSDGTSAIELEIDTWWDGVSVTVTDLTQVGKQWILTTPGDGDFVYETPHPTDEGLQNGYHELEVIVTNDNNGQSRSLTWQFYIPNSPPTLISPADGTMATTNRPTLHFSKDGINNNSLYIVNIFDPEADKVVFETVLFATGQTNYTVTVPDSRALKPQTRYLWQVFASDFIDMGEAKSEIWEFTTPRAKLFMPWIPLLLLD